MPFASDEQRRAAQAVPRMDWRSIITASEEVSPGVLSALDGYFRRFAQPPILRGENGEVVVDRQLCPGCGEVMFGGQEDFAGFLLSTFRWGLVHGEGACVRCGWPARVHHTLVDESEVELMTLTNFGLIYHPGEVNEDASRQQRHQEGGGGDGGSSRQDTGEGEGAGDGD